jgi:hypothetical protein
MFSLVDRNYCFQASWVVVVVVIVESSRLRVQDQTNNQADKLVRLV